MDTLTRFSLPTNGFKWIGHLGIPLEDSSGIFSTRSEVAWCAKKPTTECALKNNAKTDVKFSKAKFG